MQPPQGLVQKRKECATEPLQRAVLFFTPLRLIQLLLFILVFFYFQGAVRSPWVQFLDNKIYDQILRAQPAPSLEPPIVYIGIDRKSLQVIRPFPWPKRYYAAMTRILREWGAQAVVFSLFFSEAGDAPEDNTALAEEFKRTGNLYLPVSFESEGFRNYYYVNQSDPIFANEAKSVGHINYSYDPDGVVRRVFPYVKFDKKVMPHLGLLVAYDRLGKAVPGPNESVLPQDGNHSLLIRWTQRWNDAAGYYPFSDVLNAYALLAKGEKSVIGPKDFQGKICLIGLTASDFKRTPLETVSPGIGVTGNIISTVLSGDYIRTPSRTVEFLLLAVTAILGAIAFMMLPGLLPLIGGVLLAGLWVLAAFLLFTVSDFWIGAAAPILLLASYGLISFAVSRIQEYRDRMHFLNLAARDEVTGLYTMRYVSTFLSQAIHYAQKFRKPFSVVLFGIDDFKDLLASHGPRHGHLILKKVAEVIQTSIRLRGRAVPDVAGRFGDDEFIVVLVGYDLATATFGIAERIRKTVEKCEFVAGERAHSVTVSAGIGTLKFGEKDPQEVIDRAEEALLKARTGGKNRTCISPD